MNSRQANLRAVFFLIAVLVPSAVFEGAAGKTRVALSGTVEVKSEALALSDLLPPEAASDLRQAAAGIVLGDAPEPGSLRTITRGEIDDLLRAQPELRADLSLPERIVVSRRHRELTSQELSEAIRNATATGKPDAHPMNLQGMKLSAPVYVTKDDPGLKMLREEFDPLRQETRFCLWTSNEPEILPFYVTITGGSARPTRPSPVWVARRDLAAGMIVSADDFVARPSKPTAGSIGQPFEGSSGVTPDSFAGRAARAGIKAGQIVTASMFKPALMVNEGKPAVLVMEGPAFRMTMPVVALENGALGQQIRVRNPDSRRIITAEVVGPGQLHKALEN